MTMLIFTPLHLSFFLYHITVLAAGDSPYPYSPVDDIALNCGSQWNDTALDGRVWIGETNTELFNLDEQQNALSTSSTARRQPQTGGKVPYITARLSHKQFTYSFLVHPGKKFIRLYFYPTSYPNFDNSTAFFSVKAGGFTLLSNFTALPPDRGMDIVIKEFCVNVAEDYQRLNISFIPSSLIGYAYAFINGIEIVSMPMYLYYTNVSDSTKILEFLEHTGSSFAIGNDSALELMYRINMGQRYFSPEEDTGMFRSWFPDVDYILNDDKGFLLGDPSGGLKFTKIPNYTAPAVVYLNARSMGTNDTESRKYNFTWAFPVDSGFIYLVRLHFCELDPHITKMNERVFQIFINDIMAEDREDVFYWSGGIDIPYYRDFAVMMANTEDGRRKQNLSIRLHPNEQVASYYDVILNGIEIFKTSSVGSLAGSNPDLPTAIPPVLAPPASKPTKKIQIGAIIGGVVSCFLVVSLLFFLIFRRREKGNDRFSSDGDSWWDLFVSSSTKTTAKTHRSSLPVDLCRHFSLTEIMAATNNFDRVFIIGEGGFGYVYKGFIDDGATTVAIKRLNPGSQQGAKEFETEIEMLSQLRHLHLVSLIGYCNDDDEMILVYDYMPRGTLRDHLYNTDNPPLSWNQRLEICIGAARGLHYLHSGAKQMVIHRDVKTTNILLDDKWIAKVSDFGLSKLGPTNLSKAHVSTVVKGSVGYLDPEYYQRQQLTEKSDVYSFGVVLCEVLCAKPAVSRLAGNNPASLAEWVRQCCRKGTLKEIIDPYVDDKITSECLKKFSELTVSCLVDNGTERPSMSDVVWNLEFALQLQENAEEHVQFQSEIDDKMENPLKGSSIDDSSDCMFSISSGVMADSRISGITLTSSSDEQSFLSNASGKTVSGNVFSEMLNPNGR